MPNLEQSKYFIEKYGKQNNKKQRLQNLNEAFNPKIIEKETHYSFDGNTVKSYEEYFEKREEEFVYLLFIDIDDFSTKYKDLGDEELVKLLDNYYQTIIPIITDFGGVVEKTIGDGIICLFGKPFVEYDSKDDLLMKAHSCAQAIIWKTQNTDYSSKVALHSGNISYYKNQNSNYKEYTAIGSTITELFRLESVSEKNCINFYNNSDYSKFIDKKIIQTQTRRIKGQLVLPAKWFKQTASIYSLKGVGDKSVNSLILKK